MQEKKKWFEKFLSRDKQQENNQIKELQETIKQLNQQVNDYKSKLDDIGENFFTWYEQQEKENEPKQNFNEFLKEK